VDILPDFLMSWVNFELVSLKKNTIEREILKLEISVRTFLEQNPNKNIKYDGDLIIQNKQYPESVIQEVNFDQFLKFITRKIHSSETSVEEKQLCQNFIDNWAEVFQDCTAKINTEMSLQSTTKVFSKTRESAFSEFIQLNFTYKLPKTIGSELISYKTLPLNIQEWISKQKELKDVTDFIHSSNLWTNSKQYLKSKIESWVVDNNYTNKILKTPICDVVISSILEEPCLKMISSAEMNRKLKSYLLDMNFCKNGRPPKVFNDSEKMTVSGVKLHVFDVLFQEFAATGETKYRANAKA
jgi:hypothetical protein